MHVASDDIDLQGPYQLTYQAATIFSPVLSLPGLAEMWARASTYQNDETDY